MIDLKKAFKILLNWEAKKLSDMDDLRAQFYLQKERQRSRGYRSLFWPIFPENVYVRNGGELASVLMNEFGEDGLEELIVYLLNNDKGIESTDTIENYKEYEPYPSYFVEFAYILIYKLPHKTRRVFEALWENQARRRPGIYVDCTKGMLGMYIDAGVTSREEISRLLIHDWYRWQELGEDYWGPYFGPAPGPSYYFYSSQKYGRDIWLEIEVLEKEWLKKHGKRAKSYKDYLDD